MRVWWLAVLLLGCEDPDTRATTGARCVEFVDCNPVENCNCGDGLQTYQICFASRCAKDCREACQALGRL